MVVLEVDTLLLTRPAEHEERRNGQHHAYPLPDIETLAEHQQGTHQHHHRPGGIDGADNGQRQVLHAKVSENPRRQYDDRLQNHIFMHLPAARCHMQDTVVEHAARAAQDDKRQEDERREQRIEKQHGNDSVILQCLFLERVVTTQQGCRHKC